MDYQVKLSLSARLDIHDIVRYISIDAPDRGLRFGRLLIRHTKSLGHLPERGRVVPEFDHESIREIIVGRIESSTESITTTDRSRLFAFGTLGEAVLKYLND